MPPERALSVSETTQGVSKIRKLGRGVVDVFTPTFVSAPLRERRHAYPREDFDEGRRFGWFMGSAVQVLTGAVGGGLTTGSLRDGLIYAGGGYGVGKLIELGTHVYERTVREKKG